MPSVIVARWSRVWSVIRVLGVGVILCSLIVAGALGVLWLSPNGPAQAQQWFVQVGASLGLAAPPPQGSTAPAADPHAGHDHGSEPADSLTLSEQGRKNIGLKLARSSSNHSPKPSPFPG